MDRRTFIVGAGVGAVGLGTPVAHADEHNGTDDGEAAFAPEITVEDFQFSVRTDGDPPDAVRATTADGTVHEFTEDLTDWVDGGYFRAFDNALWFGEGWFGVIEEVSASRDGETVVAQNEDPADVAVTCTYMEGYEEAYDLRLHYANATKRYDPPVGDGFTFGSPGRELEKIVEMADETEIVLGDRECQTDGDPAVTFDCTSVTVEPGEFVNGPEEFYNPTLHFTDGSDQQLGDGEAFEPTATLEGTGEHAGKVVQRLTIWNDSTGAALFSYTNPDADACEPEEQNEGTEDGEAGEDQDGEQDDGSDEGNDDGTSDEEGDAEGEEDGDGTDGEGGDSGETDGDGSDGDETDEGGSGGDETGGDGSGGDETDGDGTGGDGGSGDGTDADGTDSGSDGGGRTDDSGGGQSAETDPDESESGGEAGGEEASERESHAAGSDEDGDGSQTETATDDGGEAEAESEESTGGGIEQTPLGQSESDGPGFGALATLGGIGGVAAYLARRAGMDSAEE